jgi:hypothetical protein
VRRLVAGGDRAKSVQVCLTGYLSSNLPSSSSVLIHVNSTGLFVCLLTYRRSSMRGSNVLRVKKARFYMSEERNAPEVFSGPWNRI